jgi:hypothetical protein
MIRSSRRAASSLEENLHPGNSGGTGERQCRIYGEVKGIIHEKNKSCGIRRFACNSRAGGL